MKAQLEKAIDKYITPLAVEHRFSSINEEAYGMGALHDYEAQNLFIRIVNDKGIISIEIAPKKHPKKIWDIAIFNEFLEPPKNGVLNLSLQQQTAFLNNNWVWLNDALSETNYKETLKGIAQAGKRRSDILFG